MTWPASPTQQETVAGFVQLVAQLLADLVILEEGNYSFKKVVTTKKKRIILFAIT